METKELGFIDFFKEIPDHRGNRHKLHNVEEIMLVAFCGMIAGCDSWNDLELFGKTKRYTFRRWSLVRYIGTMDVDNLRLTRVASQ